MSNLIRKLNDMERQSRPLIRIKSQEFKGAGVIKIRHRIPEVGINQIRQSLAYNYPLGDDRFRKQIENALGRRIGFKERGRPKVKEHKE